VFEEKRFTWFNSTLAYRKIGSGKNVLIAFHGYDQDSSVFEIFEPSLGKRYTIISVDLPHQGKTIWRDKELTATMLESLVCDFISHLQITGPVSLMGYSLGGNYALGFAMIKRIEIGEVWLMACDGLKNKPFFNFITKTKFGRFLFRGFIENASIIKGLINFCRQIGIFSAIIAKFYSDSIRSKELRSKLYDRWISSSRIAPNINEASAVLNSRKIPCLLIFGKEDQVIPIKNARSFNRKLLFSQLIELDQGHNLLKKENNKVIEQMILKLDNLSD
jgi:pimeloyl-ACP methyl ester carboxylesterase